MQFDFTPMNTCVILDLAAGGSERVVNGDCDIVVGAPRLRIASDHDFAAGNRDVESDPEQIALMVAPVLLVMVTVSPGLPIPAKPPVPAVICHWFWPAP